MGVGGAYSRGAEHVGPGPRVLRLAAGVAVASAAQLVDSSTLLHRRNPAILKIPFVVEAQLTLDRDLKKNEKRRSCSTNGLLLRSVDGTFIPQMASPPPGDTAAPIGL